MNIKGLLGNTPSLPVHPVDRLTRAIKSDTAHDRDANGQQAFDQNQKDQSPMSDEQIQKSIEHLKNLPFVKEHNWTIQLIEENGKKFVIVQETGGAIVRRIPEVDLWTLPLDFNDLKGQLLRKTA